MSSTVNERRKVGYFGSLVSVNTPQSLMRWVFLWSFVVINTVVWGSWAIFSARAGVMQDMPPDVVSAYRDIMLIVTAGKVIQSKFENSTPKSYEKQDVS